MEEIRQNAEITAKKHLPGVPFVKGDPRINLAGRPKGSYSLVESIRHKLQEIPEGKDKTYAEYFIEQIMKKTVVEGDVSMMKDIINRIDGLPVQRLANADGEALRITFDSIFKSNESPLAPTDSDSNESTV